MNGAACPVRAVAEFLPARPKGPVFLLHEDGTPVTCFWFASDLKRCLSAIGVQPTESGMHSFLIGAATEASRAGLTNWVVGSCCAMPVTYGQNYLTNNFISGFVVPYVWFIVHSYVFWAAQRVDCRPGGRNL